MVVSNNMFQCLEMLGESDEQMEVDSEQTHVTRASRKEEKKKQKQKEKENENEKRVNNQAALLRDVQSAIARETIEKRLAAQRQKQTSFGSEIKKCDVPSNFIKGGDNYYRAFLMVERDIGTGDVYVMFHKTVIVFVRRRTGQVTLNSGGYRTITTRMSMLDALMPLGVTIDANWTTVYTPSGRISYNDPVTFAVVTSSSASSVSDSVFMGLRQLNVAEGRRVDLRKKETSQSSSRFNDLANKARELAYSRKCALQQPLASPPTVSPPSQNHHSLLTFHDASDFPPLRQLPSADETFKRETPQIEPVQVQGGDKEGQRTPPPSHRHSSVDQDDENVDQSLLCVMCLESYSSVILMPCSHGCLCTACTHTIMTCHGNPCQGLCPVCKSPIDDCLDILD